MCYNSSSLKGKSACSIITNYLLIFSLVNSHFKHISGFTRLHLFPHVWYQNKKLLDIANNVNEVYWVVHGFSRLLPRKHTNALLVPEVKELPSTPCHYNMYWRDHVLCMYLIIVVCKLIGTNQIFHKIFLFYLKKSAETDIFKTFWLIQEDDLDL